MDKFIEICKETTYCMRYPQEDSFGWFLWAVWLGALLFIIVSLWHSKHMRHVLWDALKQPTEYRGRMGKEAFLSVYFGLQTLRVLVVVFTAFAVAILNNIHWMCVCVLAGGSLFFWMSITIYSCIVRRGHDFNFAGKESLMAYFSRLNRFVRDPEDNTWQVICSQRGNPYANRYGSAPQENNYLIAPEDPFERRTAFPSVWDEADWQNWKK